MAEQKLQARITFCEFATVHPDGTFTIVRGGIDRLFPLALPFISSLGCFVELPAGVPGGEHNFVFRLVNSDDVALIAYTAQLTVKMPEAPTRAALPLQIAVVAYGTYRGIVEVANCYGEQILNISKPL